MRISSLLTFTSTLSLVLAAPTQPGTEGRTQSPATNAEAIAMGLPLLPPVSVFRCPPGGCTPESEAQWKKRRERKRTAAPSPVPVSPTTTTATCPPAGPTSGTNLQTYTEGIGGIYAPPVYGCGEYYYQSGIRYNFLIDALNQSCYVQMDKCQLAANQGGNKEPLTVSNCNGRQIEACRSNAQSFSEASSKG